MVTVAELKAENDNRGLVRKISRAVAFLAPNTVELPESLTGEDGTLTALPEDWLPVGIVTPDGYTFGADIDKDEIDALGYASPVRTDIMSVVRSVSFTPLEYGRRHMLELTYGQDLSGVTPTAGGEITFDEVDLPINAEWRLLIIGDDGPASDNWLLGRGYPRVKLGERSEEQWQKEGAVQQEITLDVFTDDDLGTPVRHYIAGTGAVKHAESLGFVGGSGPGD
ncbi:MAG TPA: hypothetical protein VK054_00945 [Beutenbergiaceae bacterium]|nr:hypothetical protein [Beutenbergiaceae bacterium]